MTNDLQKSGLSGGALKIIAPVTMFIDPVGGIVSVTPDAARADALKTGRTK